MSDNLELWESVKETDKDYVKGYSEGNVELSAINPTYQKMRATEKWGPFGGKWGIKDPVFTNIELGESRKENGKKLDIVKLLSCNYTATFYYPDGEFPVESAKQITFSNGSFDAHYSKKCVTDAISKGLSHLGFSADIYMQKYDDVISNPDNKNTEDDKGGLESYTKSGKKGIPGFVDPFDKPEVKASTIEQYDTEVKVDKKVKEKVIKDKIEEKPKSKIDIEFEEKVNKSEYSESKKKDLLNNPQITESIKQHYINGKMDF